MINKKNLIYVLGDTSKGREYQGYLMENGISVKSFPTGIDLYNEVEPNLEYLLGVITNTRDNDGMSILAALKNRVPTAITTDNQTGLYEKVRKSGAVCCLPSKLEKNQLSQIVNLFEKRQGEINKNDN